MSASGHGVKRVFEPARSQGSQKVTHPWVNAQPCTPSMAGGEVHFIPVTCILETHNCSLGPTPQVEAGRASEMATPRASQKADNHRRPSVCVNWRYCLSLKRIDVLLNWPLSEEMVATNNLDWPLARSVN